MKQINWFERKFDFSFQQNIFPSIIERLDGTTVRLNEKIRQISPQFYEIRQSGKWSIKENIGHLTDLEPLWQGRLSDILARKSFLREADLSNQGTHLAQHNKVDVADLLSRFEEKRRDTIKRLKRLNENEIYQTALHPRLKQAMRTMDLFLFVADHDDHHLARISEINSILNS